MVPTPLTENTQHAPREPLGVIRAGGPATLVAGLFATALGVVYAIAFTSGFGQHADAAIFHRVSLRDLDQVRTLGSHVGRHALNSIAVAAILVVAAAVTVIALVRGRLGQALAVPVLLAGSFATTEVIKPPLGRLGRHLAPSRIASDSFPSGHATIAMAAVLAAVIAAPAVLRMAVVIVGTIYATLAAVLIVAVGLHPPSDVLAGYLVSGTWAALLIAFLGRHAEAPRIPPRRDRSRGRVAMIAGFALATILLMLSATTQIFPAVERHETFVTTIATFAMASAAIVLAVAWLSAERELLAV